MNDRVITVLPTHLPVLGAAASQQGTKVIGINQDPCIYRQSDHLFRSARGIEISGELRVTIRLSAEMIQGVQQGLRGRIHAGPQVMKERYQGTFTSVPHKVQPGQEVVDAVVVTGSFNWSPSPAHQNDEVLLVIRSPQVAAHFSREMDRLWRSADLGITERLRRKLERNRQRCGSGIARD